MTSYDVSSHLFNVLYDQASKDGTGDYEDDLINDQDIWMSEDEYKNNIDKENEGEIDTTN